MKILLLTSGFEATAAFREFAERKLKSELDRIETRIERVEIKIEDESRGSRAFDGRCRIDAWLVPRGHLHVSATGSTEHETLIQAARKLEHAIMHAIDRRRTSSRVRHEHVKTQLDNEPLDTTEEPNNTEQNSDDNPGTSTTA